MSGDLSLSVLRDAVIGELKARAPGVRSVEKHGGDVTMDLLKRYAQDAPCLRVSINGVAAMYRHGSGLWCLPVQMSVIVITKDQAEAGVARIDRDMSALALAGAVSLITQANRWGLDGVRQPENLRADNEFSGEIDKMGLAAWQVIWTQDVLLGETEAAIARLSQVWINGAVFDNLAAPQTGAAPDPVRMPLGDPLGFVRPLDSEGS